MKFLGVLLILIALFIGLYFGAWICFFGGIAAIIVACMTGTATVGLIMWNLFCIFILTDVWALIAVLLGSVGIACITE